MVLGYCIFSIRSLPCIRGISRDRYFQLLALIDRDVFFRCPHASTYPEITNTAFHLFY